MSACALLAICMGIGSVKSETLNSSLSVVHDELLAIGHEKLPVAERVKSMSVVYDAKLRDLKTPLDKLDNYDLRALQDSLDLLSAYTMFSDYDRNEVYVDRLLETFQELRRRSSATPGDYKNSIGALISRRDFVRARELNALAPPDARTNLPEIVRGSSFKEGLAAELALSTDHSSLLLRNVNLEPGARIVVVAGCHFGRDAAEAIDADPVLKAAFVSGNAVWLEPGGRDLNLSEIGEWNSRFPEFPMTIAYKNRDWIGIDFSRIPTFYFYRDGSLIASYQGWSKTETPPLLMDALRKIDLLKVHDAMGQQL